MRAFAILSMLALSIPASVQGGPIAYGVCQTGCNTLVVACYAGAGLVFGTVTAGIGTPLAALGCNAGLGVCSAACAATALIAPTP